MKSEFIVWDENSTDKCENKFINGETSLPTIFLCGFRLLIHLPPR